MKPFLFWKLCRKLKKKKFYFPRFDLKHKARKARLLLLEKIEKLPSTTIKLYCMYTLKKRAQAIWWPWSHLLHCSSLQSLRFSTSHPLCLFWTKSVSLLKPLVLCRLMVLSLPPAVSEGLISVFRHPRLAWDSKMFEGTEQILNIL